MDAPKKPTQMGLDASTPRQFELTPEFRFVSPRETTSLCRLSALFVWDSVRPNPQGYELTEAVVEPSHASREIARRVLSDYVDGMRWSGYEMADLPFRLPLL